MEPGGAEAFISSPSATRWSTLSSRALGSKKGCDANCCKAVFSLRITPGNTWIFREDLEKNGFGGARAENDSNSYYRFLKDVDVTAEASRNTILSLVDLFNKQLVRVCVDPPAEEESEVAAFLEELRQQPTMIFA